MRFNDHVKQIIDRDITLKDQIQAEEAPTNAFFMTFLQSSGYDVFNPTEIVPGFISDIGLKKGEKIGYAIFRVGKPSIGIECKHWTENQNIQGLASAGYGLVFKLPSLFDFQK